MFDLIEYNKSHETDTPIRNKWFKFFKLDESACKYSFFKCVQKSILLFQSF